MECPNCGLTNPETAEICDCGYDFKRGVRSSPPEWARPPEQPPEKFSRLLAMWSVGFLLHIPLFAGLIFVHVEPLDGNLADAAFAPVIIGPIWCIGVILASRLPGLTKFAWVGLTLLLFCVMMLVFGFIALATRGMPAPG